MPANLAELQREVSELKSVSTDAHQTLLTEIGKLTQQLNSLESGLQDGSNPSYATLKHELDAMKTRLTTETNARIDAIDQEQKRISKAVIADLESRLDTLEKFLGLRDTGGNSPGESKIKEYIASASSSSARARSATYVLAVTSLVIFSTFWNLHPGSWLKERLSVAREVEDFLDFNRDGKGKLKEKKKWAWPAAELTVDRKVHRDLIEGFITSRRLDRDEAAKKYREKLEDLYYGQSYQVKIPFFGVTYDINDLGMLGGFAFFMVLMILRFSLARELANLKIAFEEARKIEELEVCYKLLSMEQVLTVPPHTGVVSTLFTRNLHKTLYILPILIHGWIFVNDLSTFDVGLTFSRFNTILTMIVSACFFILIGLLTYQCIHSSNQFDKEWRRAWRVISPRGEESSPSYSEGGNTGTS